MSELEKDLDLDLDLEEAKGTGEDSESADPVTPEGGNDKSKAKPKAKGEKADNVEDDVKTPQGSNDAGLKEAVERLFEGTDLSEDFKSSAVAVFEAAVHEKVLAETATLEEKFESDLQEQVEKSVEEIVEKVDQYLDYVIENWMDDNQVAVESNIKVEVAESLLGSIKGLVSEHNLEIDQETVDHNAELEVALEESQVKYNELVEEMMAIKEAKKEADLEAAFKTVSEELTDTQAEKLRVLSEGISYESTEDYSKKLEAIKDNYFVESAPAPVAEEESTDLLQEETAEDVQPAIDPTMASYAESLTRFVKK
jgi:hypothetical protein